MKNQFKCQGCGKSLNASGMLPRSSAGCPNCGNVVTVPFPGMKGGKFFWLYCLVFVAGLLVSGMMGSAGVLVLPFWLAAKLRLGYLRAINIGWHPAACLLALLPFIGALALACYGEGEGMKRAATAA